MNATPRPRIRYESGAFTCWYKTPTEREYNTLKGIIEGPPEETPGWHSGISHSSGTARGCPTFR